jgi:choline-sulfatase
MSKVSRRDFNQQLALGAASIAAFGPGLKALEVQSATNSGSHPASSGSKRPNFVFISSDQHSFRYAHFMGHPLVKTPNLDKIAARGAVLENNYCGSPICSPARSCMMTGMYSSDLNSFGNTTVYDGSYPTWGKRLSDAGYYCWATGKADLNHSLNLGFEGALTNEHSESPDITELFRRPTIFRMGERELVDGESRNKRFPHDVNVAQEASDFIKNKARSLDKPWALYAGFHMPHPRFSGFKEYFDYYLPLVQPVVVPEKYLEDLEMPLPYQVMRHYKRIATPIARAKIVRAYAGYFAMITELDEYIGQIYSALEASGQLENTYFVYTTDHGEALGYNGLWLKSNLFDGAAHIPFVFSGPGVTPGQRIAEPTGHIDFVAAMMEWAGIGQVKELRGKSLTPLLTGQKETSPRFAYTEGHCGGNPAGSFLLRMGDWKLIHFTWYEDCLFNLKDDPNEYHNLIDSPEYKEKATELQNKLHSLVDTEAITMRAFNCQSQYLEKFNKSLSEEELFGLLKGRIGKGQAKYLAQKLKSGMLS